MKKDENPLERISKGRDFLPSLNSNRADNSKGIKHNIQSNIVPEKKNLDGQIYKVRLCFPNKNLKINEIGKRTKNHSSQIKIFLYPVMKILAWIKSNQMKLFSLGSADCCVICRRMSTTAFSER